MHFLHKKNFSLLKIKENALLACFSLFLGASALVFVASKKHILSAIMPDVDDRIFFFLFFALFLCIAGTVLFFQKTISPRLTVKKMGITLLPFFIPLLLGIILQTPMPWELYLGTGLYTILFGYWIMIKLWKNKDSDLHSGKSSHLKPWHWIVVITVMCAQFFFGYANIGKQSLVDESLWFFNRIEKYWDSIAEQNWKGTSVNDKPGITVAIFSGIGLLFQNPDTYQSTHTPERENLYAALRIPIFVISVLLLPLWFYFLAQLFRAETALLSILFIGLHPLLLGMSRMVNPDSLFWIFAPLSILAFFTHLKYRKNSGLVLSGVFLGLALLTKYVACILFVFFLGVFLIETLFRRLDNSALLYKEMRSLLLKYISLIFISLSVFYILFPAVWTNPKKLLTATLFSQAFETTWPYYISFLILLLIDAFLFKSAVLLPIVRFLSKKKVWILRIFLTTFSVSALIMMANVFFDMRWIDFESIVASPKSSHNIAGAFAFYLSHFYSLFFGISPLLITALFASMIGILFKKNPNRKDRFVSYIVFFLLLYYLGLTATEVAATVRYQIVLYPLALILSAFGIQTVLQRYIPNIKTAHFTIIVFGLFLFSMFTLWKIHPFYFSYASTLLPKQYVLNLKEMGDGSYQAAEYLNRLENAKNISIWSDKDGVCVVFVGKCNSDLDFRKLIISQKHFDYYVVSKGREIRTTRLIENKIRYNPQYLIRFDKLYSFEKPEFQIALGNRESNFVKIINAHDIDISYQPDPNKPQL